ncbi:MAG: hypothetical protein KAU24_01415 [Candidatus Aenigmarchaeota archaeon]|nr:hypothetical protein [Candidatus Aenigmarchaeota archaeon]
MSLEKIRKGRFQFLNKLFELSEGDEGSWHNMWKIGEELEFDRKNIHKIVQYLRGEGLIQDTGMGGEIGITHWGIREMEEALSNPNEPTNYFPPVNIINVGHMVNSQIQQASPQSTQTIVIKENKYDELIKIVKELNKSINKLGIQPEQISELKFDIKTIESQIKSPNPKHRIISESLSSVRRILEGATATMIASGFLSKIITLLGSG